mmetsp:Transcript_20530/g.31638  ORF Transcript_20530/g.31638 Transcript_20530/m.31638 type:complete len:346 (-) Transcript_20530:13-1050(-)
MNSYTKDVVLVTGASGFIAKHVIQALLNEGVYLVRGTVRSEKSERVMRSLFGSQVEIVRANLEEDKGWNDAVKGCKYVLHIAAPLPLETPVDREALVPVTKGGTVRVINAALAENVERIVLTSSLFTLMYKANRPAKFKVSEQDWTDPEWRRLGADEVAKTRAELSAWELVSNNQCRSKLTVINPGWVLGPRLDSEECFSSKVFQLFLEGAYPAAPPVSYAVVDVRDIALTHVRAMKEPRAAGRRLIVASEVLSFHDICMIIRDTGGAAAKKVPERVFPKWFVHFAALFDRTLRNVVNDMGCVVETDSQYVSEMLGVAFRPARESIQAMCRSILDEGIPKVRSTL